MSEVTSSQAVSRVSKGSVLQYILLALLLGLAATYQSLVARDVFRSILHPGSTIYEAPFTVAPTTAIVADAGTAAKAGLRKGDLLLAVNGVPYTGTHVLDEAVNLPGRDRVLTVSVRAAGIGSAPTERSLHIPLLTYRAAGEATPSLALSRALLFVVMPCFSVALGFWVAAVRPRDPLAWLLLAVLLGFSQLLYVETGSWGPGLRDFGRAYQLLWNDFWPIAMLLFGLYFPEPFPQADRRVWKWLQWTVVSIMAVCVVPVVLFNTIAVENYAPVATLSRHFTPITSLGTFLSYCAVSFFFAALFTKGSMAVSRDARRRLRLLYFGSTVSLAPGLVVAILGLLEGQKNLGQLVPEWLLFTLLLLLLLFPLTLAYTIVVQRALDVRVAIRQGLQYALARGGVRAVNVALLTILIGVALFFLRHVSARSPWFYLVVISVATLAAAFPRLRDWLNAAIDRRFFRDAYNTEQILGDLGEQVQSIVDTQALLATVSQRIAESLHVPRVAALLNGNGLFCPAYALGYDRQPEVLFAENSATIRQLTQTREPTRVYFEDPNSWIYERPALDGVELQQLKSLGTELLLPLCAQDTLLGFMSLSQKLSEAPFSSTDLHLLKSVSLQTGLALQNARLTATVAREIAEREKLNHEVEIAREVQQRLFPQKLPPMANLDYAGACRPALGVGGDYYDFLSLPDGRLGIALGDVSGKGIAAALMMATLQASLRAEAMRSPCDLSHMMSAVNRLLYEASTANRYATFFYAQYDPANQLLTYVNAGHNPPIHISDGNGTSQLLRLEPGGTVIGLLEEASFEQGTLTLGPGDTLVLYTDGISEAINPGDEEWGEARLIETLRRCHGLSAAETIRSLMKAADAFTSEAPQFDDMTLVVLRAAPITECVTKPARNAVMNSD